MQTIIKQITLVLCFFIISNLSAQDLVFEWANQMGGTGFDQGESIGTDAKGNIYTTGFFKETVDFDPGLGNLNFISNGADDVFIQKLDSCGNFLWLKQIGGTSQEKGVSVVDSNGNIYTTGFFKETVDFDPGIGNVVNLSSNGLDDLFIQKLDSSGNFLWVKQMGGIGRDYAHAITMDASGNIYTTGRFQETVDFDPGGGTALLSSSGSWDIYIQKLDSNGNFLWVKQMGGIDSDQSHAITVDASGNVHTTGTFKGIADFNPGADTLNLSSNGIRDIFIQKLDSDGNFLWAKHIGGTEEDLGRSITTDSSGNVYTTGHFKETVDFNPGVGTANLNSNGLDDVFIQKLDSNGNYVWAKKIGSVYHDYSTSVITDADGNIYTTGSFRGTVDFDPGIGTNNLSTIYFLDRDVFIQKLDPSGNLLWVKQMGGTGVNWSAKSHIDSRGTIYTTGSFKETIDLDPDSGVANFISNGSSDIFIQKLSECQTYYATDVQNACYSFIWLDGNTYTSNNNTASYIIEAGAIGCDSIISLDLTINSELDVSTSINDFTITANNNNANSYQWLDCNAGMSIISGETNNSFTPTMDGNYAVQITESDCVDTSACVLVLTVGLIKNSFSENIQVSPNPTNGNFTLEFENNQKKLSIRILTISGQIIETSTFHNTNLVQMKLDRPSGVYLLEILDEDGNKATTRLIKL